MQQQLKELTNEATLAYITPEELDRVGNWINVYSGQKYYPLDPRESEVDIVDIAHSLSLLCRYNGHIRKFYSVAEHCYLISQCVPSKYALEGLLHDASEAYTSDVPRPLKYATELSLFREIENLNTKVIYKKFNLSYPESAIVKEYDARIVANEKNNLFKNLNVDFRTDKYPEIEGLKIKGWSPKTAKLKYLERFCELTK